MHYACMVVGPDPDRQLEPFSEHLEVPRYKDFLDQRGVELMARHYGLPPTDIHGLAAKMPDWDEREGGVEDGRLFRWSTSNPNSKYDWYERGGRFAGYLQLKEPRPPAAWRKLFGARPAARVEQARKSEVRAEPLLAEPPAALLLQGEWHECPITSDTAELERWKQRFAALFAAIPPDAMLTVLDLHS